MDNQKMALSYLHGAKSRLESAKNAFNGKDFPYVVRLSQECVELSLKSALRFVGIEPPKWHDVGFILK
ncbi:MAG: HEPN domain-containing protein [Candidatus Methanoperedenaceae archaeon]|nr:HEPN domain-containing protein [Euryarchaeota archaeon]MCG2727636.1 HEPN domain-containing protein [Candidatus Methanoperedenaceae archaeon]